uniref:Venom peptide HtC6Tx1 n=1 Tax=Hadogenes troglodytes TaxID=1577150 RepID=A0A1B3IJ08_9SCOR|nr:venom peptide HtC6Tx1 [Hadogenes troglodytes]
MKTLFILVLLTIAIAAIAGAFECEEEGYFQDPDDCSRYIQCDENNRPSQPMECGPGLHFDDDTKVCDYPDRVECKGSKN